MTDDWAIDGMQRREQSVTSDWDITNQPPIAGVVIHDTRSVPTSYGHLAEVWRADWRLDANSVDQVFTSVIQPGAVTGWHVHGSTVDRLFVVAGQLLIVLYDGRRRSPSYGIVNEWRFGAVRPGLVVVPPGVWHGVKNECDEVAILLNAVDKAYSYESPDHWSIPADSTAIPYRLLG